MENKTMYKNVQNEIITNVQADPNTTTAATTKFCYNTVELQPAGSTNAKQAPFFYIVLFSVFLCMLRKERKENKRHNNLRAGDQKNNNLRAGDQKIIICAPAIKKIIICALAIKTYNRAGHSRAK
jgi:hypothetical protein